MKVTVCFGGVRVVVPCGEGDITVHDLIREATLRYKKATGKSSDSWVAVQSLQTSDGGILDPDDRLNDVVDDREQILATYSDGDGPHHGGGDGASGSSVGTTSPDIFQGEKLSPAAVDIEVTSDMPGGCLHVRRGSDSALNQLEGGDVLTGGGPGPPTTPASANKRWSAAPIIRDLEPVQGRHMNGHSEDWRLKEEDENKLNLPNGKFQRDGSSRLSMQFLMDGPGLKWMDAVDRMGSGAPRDRRREPLGQANIMDYGSLPRAHNPAQFTDPIPAADNIENTRTELIVLGKEGGPLGIHVVPDYDSAGRDRGLLVQGIEPNGRVARDGRLAIFDRIVEINGANLLNKPFHRVQEIFKNSLSSGELRLRVVPHTPAPYRNGLSAGTVSVATQKPPQPVYPNDVTGMPAVIASPADIGTGGGRVACVSPSKKAPAAAKTLLTANTRRIGRRIELDLVKGPAGLGFSITTRDNPAGGKSPIYIKNILSKGAAVDDGRLCPGDRLLTVNGIEMTGKTQPEAVAILRQIPPGAAARIVVSRQEDLPQATESPEKPPRALRQERCVDNSGSSINGSPNPENSSLGNLGSPVAATAQHSRKLSVDSPLSLSSHPHKLELKPQRSLDESQIYPWRHREVLTLDIPVHDTEKAGLGVSVKGKTSAHAAPNANAQSPQQTVDLGIFIKSVIHGGAASRDGRLRTNDQLLSVNGKSLLNQSNANAMEALRRAMLYENGPRPGVISLTIARRAPSPLDISRGSSTSGNDVTPDNSIGSSETSESTVIFLPHQELLDSSYQSDSGPELRHPVIDRLTGHHSGPMPNALRNESYYRATHDTTWNTSNMIPPYVKGLGRLQSPTVNPVLAEPVLIEDDFPGPAPRGPPHPVAVPLQTQRADGSVSGSGSISTHGDVTYASQQSLEEPAGFARDAVGRQSMSEKRHATLDAKSTDTYRRNKKMREERSDGGGSGRHQDAITGRIAEIRQELLQRRSGVRVGSAESIAAVGVDQEPDGANSAGRSDVGPSLGMRKSSSLESLQTMVQEIQMAEDGDAAYTYRTAQQGGRVVRGRGCNDSFRAAVDRSYDASLALHQAMETLSEEEGIYNVSGEEPVGLVGRGTPRQSSMNAAHDAKNKLKKKPGLLKGIGSMFRFGKHRKPLESELEEELAEAERERNERTTAEIEQQKMQEQYRRAQQQQPQQQQPYQLPSPQPSEDESRLAEGQTARKLSTEDGNESSGSRSQRIQQLRQQHQRRHVQRQGQYPLEEQQEHYEHIIRQRLDYPKSGNAGYYEASSSARQPSSGSPHQSYDPQVSHLSHQSHHGHPNHQQPNHLQQVNNYKSNVNSVNNNNKNKQVTDGRAGSRSGVADAARFSHYVNYEEIQQHLNRRKQQYHSQRRDPREAAQQRPVSNFYEYESVQSVITESRHDSLPRRHKPYKETETRHETVQRHKQYPEADSSHESMQRQKPHYDVELRYDTMQRTNKLLHGHGSDPLSRRLEEEHRTIHDSLARRTEDDSKNNNPALRSQKDSLPRRLEEEFQRQSRPMWNQQDRPVADVGRVSSVRSTVNYLNQLSKHDPSNLRAKGPFVSQVTIRENPDES